MATEPGEEPIRNGDRRTVTIYRPELIDRWDRMLAEIRERHTGERTPSQGECAGQAFAEYLGEPGPLDEEV